MILHFSYLSNPSQTSDWDPNLTFPKMSRIAVCDLLPHLNVLHSHKDRALVDIEPHRVGVTAVIDKGEWGVEGNAESLQCEVVTESLDLMGVVHGGTDHLVDHTEQECLHLRQTGSLPCLKMCWNEDIKTVIPIPIIHSIPDLKYPAFFKNLRKKTERTEFLTATSGSMSSQWVIRLHRAL